jgi:hypothetical protein
MRLRTLSTFAAAAALLLAAAGCGDTPAAPKSAATPPTAASNSLLGGLLGGTTTTTTNVVALQRTKPLSSNLTASATIGALGGILSIPAAGITVVVPPAAVLSPIKMSVTALAGSNVAYEFQPHGTKFLVPLVVTQNLVNTQAATGLVSVNQLFVGYFPDDKNILSVTDILSLNVNLLNMTAIFTVPHFSGYIFASGRAGE